jgi:glucose/mannose-6-phosphate isomerase
MEQLISGFSTQLEHAFEIFNQYPFKQNNEEISQVVFCGMGGSGIGGRIVAQWVEQEIQVPITFIQNYEIPNWINKSTLVIASSYSGNTEETLEAVRCCQNRGARIICISSGGGLRAFCNQYNLDCILIPSGLPPRAALGFSLVQQLGILVYHGLIEKKVFQQLHGCIEFLKIHQSAIKQIANEAVPVINHTNVVIYSEASYESVAIRGKQQMNENSKFLCRHNTIPEMNHNELLGWGCGDSNHSALFLYTSGMHTQNSKRFALTREIVANKTERTMLIDAKGTNQIEQSMYLIHLLDWLSLYLGYERGQDIVEIDNINYLKQQLAKK